MIKHYHIWRGDKRTSVSVHETLDKMLSLRLGGTPDPNDRNSQKAVTKWVQSVIDNETDENQQNLSQWLQGRALDFIMSGKNMPQLWENWKKIELSRNI
jgi:hypothetical protein